MRWNLSTVIYERVPFPFYELLSRLCKISWIPVLSRWILGDIIDDLFLVILCCVCEVSWLCPKSSEHYPCMAVKVSDRKNLRWFWCNQKSVHSFSHRYLHIDKKKALFLSRDWSTSQREISNGLLQFCFLTEIKSLWTLTVLTLFRLIMS